MNMLSGNSRDQARSSASPASTANLSESEREARWKIITLKLLWVLRNFTIKHCTQAVLGRDAYQRIFHRIKNTAESSKGIVSRVINGEIVGKPLPRGKADDCRILPEMCPHEAKHMKGRGNKNTMWWTCANCQSRWERRTVDTTPATGPPTDTEVLTFGKCVGQTYKQTATKNPDYCQWILQTADGDGDSCPQLKRFAQYLVDRERTAVDALAPREETESESEASNSSMSDAELL